MVKPKNSGAQTAVTNRMMGLADRRLVWRSVRSTPIGGRPHSPEGWWGSINADGAAQGTTISISAKLRSGHVGLQCRSKPRLERLFAAWWSRSTLEWPMQNRARKSVTVRGGGSKSAAPQLNLDEQKGAILFGFCLVKSYFILYGQDIISRIIGPSIYEPSFGHF